MHTYIHTYILCRTCARVHVYGGRMLGGPVNDRGRRRQQVDLEVGWRPPQWRTHTAHPTEPTRSGYPGIATDQPTLTDNSYSKDFIHRKCTVCMEHANGFENERSQHIPYYRVLLKRKSGHTLCMYVCMYVCMYACMFLCSREEVYAKSCE